MDTFWQKLKLWLRIAVLGLVVIHALIFIFLNLSIVVEPRLHMVYTTYDRPNFLVVMLCTSIISIFGWWLFWLVFRTIRQLRTANDRARADKLEREMADMKSKAAKLQTRPDVDPSNSRII